MSVSTAPKPLYALQRIDGSMIVKSSKTAAVRANRELAALALSIRKGVWVSHDDGATWEPFHPSR